MLCPSLNLGYAHRWVGGEMVKILDNRRINGRVRFGIVRTKLENMFEIGIAVKETPLNLFYGEFKREL